MVLGAIPAGAQPAVPRAKATAKRVVPKASTFTLRVNDEPVPTRGKPLCVYVVERDEGPNLWLVPEQPGPTGWAKADDVVPVDQAIDFFTKEIQAHPSDAFLHAMRGLIRQDRSEYEPARRDYDEAVRLDPADASLLTARGGVSVARRDLQQAIADFDKALERDPKCTAAWIGRGSARMAQRERYKAIADFSEAIWCNPLSIPAYIHRGLAWHALGEHQKAIVDFDRAILLDSQQSAAFCHRGEARAAMRSYRQALADYDEALRLDPRETRALGGRAWLMATCPDAQFRDGKQAIASATRACELTGWKDPQFLGTLAAACAEAGDFERAVQWQTKTNELASSSDEDRAQGAVRLALYKSRKPLRVTR